LPLRVAKEPFEMTWTRWLPGLVTLREYQAEWLRNDIVAGVVLATMLVPVGIAYAVASGVPGIYGLYATIVPLLAYALFGPSRILVLGPDSSLAPLILAVVLPLSAGDPVHAIAIASMMAIVSGIVCIGAGLARLGFITELLSKPIRYGYMNGIALTVLISQLPKIFGFSILAQIVVWIVVGAVAWLARRVARDGKMGRARPLDQSRHRIGRRLDRRGNLPAFRPLAGPRGLFDFASRCGDGHYRLAHLPGRALVRPQPRDRLGRTGTSLSGRWR
jgi:Sulfate permease family